MATVYLALGANVGDSRANIAQAVKLLGNLIAGIKQAPVYRSRALGYTDQPDFLNTAVSGQADLEPEALLKQIKNIERKIGRTATFHHGPREIDIDIIFYDDLVRQTKQLTIPHPEFRNRDFVLQPLCDMDPALTDPTSGQTVHALLASLTPEQKSLIQRVDAEA